MSKKYFMVSINYGDGIYGANIAHADSENTIRDSEYGHSHKIIGIRPCEDYEVTAATRRGMPVVDFPEYSTYKYL